MNTFLIAKITGIKHQFVLRRVKKLFKGNKNVVEGEAHHECNNQIHLYYELPDFELALYATGVDDVKSSQELIAYTGSLFTKSNDSWDSMIQSLDCTCKDNHNQLKARHRLFCDRVKSKLIQLGLNPENYEVKIMIRCEEIVSGYELPLELVFVFAQGLLKNRKQLLEYLIL